MRGHCATRRRGWSITGASGKRVSIVSTNTCGRSRRARVPHGANPMATASNAVLAGDREILLTRVFRAPRELVWRAWTNPDQLGQWWGPRGFSTHTHHMDVR